jgi:hypothetical protein
MIPEALILTVATASLFINPTPFPYNLVTVVPFAFLLGYRFVRLTLPIVRANQQLMFVRRCVS